MPKVTAVSLPASITSHPGQTLSVSSAVTKFTTSTSSNVGDPCGTPYVVPDTDWWKYTAAQTREDKLIQADRAIGLLTKAREDAPSLFPACGPQSSFIKSDRKLIDRSSGKLDTAVANDMLQTLAATGIDPKWHDEYDYTSRGSLHNTGNLIVSNDPDKSEVIGRMQRALTANTSGTNTTASGGLYLSPNLRLAAAAAGVVAGGAMLTL